MVALGFDLGYYVKVQHGFICFYLQNMLIQNFMMSKNTLFDIANKLRPLIVKKDIGYYFAIHVKVQVIYMIYKLSYDTNLLTYNELFIISKSTSMLVTCEIMKIINIESKIGGGCNVKVYKLLCFT